MSLIRLQFVLGSDFSSKLISWWGQGYNGYSHVDAVLPSARVAGEWELAGARSDSIGGKPPGCQIRPDNYEKWVRRTVVSLPTTPEKAWAWEKYLRDGAGLPYDKADILGLLIGKPLMSAGHWICSAWQTDDLQQQRLMPSLGIEPQQVAPNALLVACRASGWRTLVP